jgi:hypothetical protein
MMGRIAVLAALLALAACASVESAGRNARSGAPSAQTDLPPPQAGAPAAPGPLITSPAQPGVSAPPPTQTASAQDASEPEDDGAIVVPGQREMQVQPPAGDPRSVAERMRDVRAWDQCITASQAAFESDPMRPQLESPEEQCSRSLGMASRTAVPDSRRR